MAKTKVIIGIFILALALLGFIVLNNSTTASGYNSDVELTGETKEFTIEAFKFGFSPDTIEVNLGDNVKITASSIDVPHGLSIPGYGVNLYLDGLRDKTAEFVADKKGTFRFFCSVPCGSGHSEMGGQLIVR